MKRILSFSIIACLLFALIPFSSISTVAETVNAPKRVINLVFDDSGSMIDSKKKPNKNDRWCQAKYAMEVFASMLGDNDSMNVYYMSDYVEGDSAPPKLKLYGKDGRATNIKKVHDTITRAWETPFASVRKAYSDLSNVDADEKWLVVLTDGHFQGGNMKSFVKQKSEDIKIYMLAMGKDIPKIDEDKENNIFFRNARNSDQILSELTEISTTVFNSNKIKVDSLKKDFSFDIPMGELVVFAQGANVSIKGILDPSGKTIKSSEQPVTVKYSNKPATNRTDFAVDKSLEGSVAVFKNDFKEGNYKVDVSGAKTIEVYYKPNIEIAAYLKDSDGDEVTDMNALEQGEYQIDFSFVKGGSKEKVKNSKLLGEIKYQAKVTNNGKKHGKTYTSGDKIQIEEGPLEIEVEANYLKYHSVTSDLKYTVYKNKKMVFDIDNNPVHKLTSNGFEKTPPIKVHVTLDEKEISKSQWDKMDVPEVKLVNESEIELDNIKVEKDKECGCFNIYPSFKNDNLKGKEYHGGELLITYRKVHDNETWSGKGRIPLKISDERSWFEKNRDLIITLIIIAILFFIVLGYMPFVKHYLPKSLKKKPYIKCVPSELGADRKDREGLVEKNLASTIIPYVSQKGKIKYVPRGVTGAPALAVKAIKGRRMSITNIKAFANKDYITFDGTTIQKDINKFETGAGVCIKVNRNGWTYTCTPSQSR